jgi:tetratricopeptide (TPR) repeat protein
MRTVSILVLKLLLVLTPLSISAQTDLRATPVEYYHLLNQANGFYDQGNYQKSEELLTRLIEVNAHDGDLWFKLGDSRFNLKKYQEAIDPFKKAIELGFI